MLLSIVLDSGREVEKVAVAVVATVLAADVVIVVVVGC